MRIRSASLLLLLVPLAVGQEVPVPVLSELHPDPDGGREFVELHNPHADAIDLTGWRIEDAAGTGHTFARILPAGARVVVWSGGDADALGPAMASATVWNNGGDTARLLDPAGTVVATLTYGTADTPAPAKGSSLQRDGDAWVEAAPSPGAGPGEAVGAASATVEDVPPRVAFLEVPDLRPGEAGTVSVSVRDDNGDLAYWSLSHDDALLAEGTEPGVHEVVVSFSTAGTRALVLGAEDPAGQTAHATAELNVAESALVVTVPPELAFPSLPPGGGPVDATQPFLLGNGGDRTLTPRIDVSDLQGPATIPVAGHLRIGTRSDAAQSWTWTDYDGPLTPLPDLPAGSQAEVMLRLLDVPVPLAAGDYHTSFTVIP